MTDRQFRVRRRQHLDHGAQDGEVMLVPGRSPQDIPHLQRHLARTLLSKDRAGMDDYLGQSSKVALRWGQSSLSPASTVPAPPPISITDPPRDRSSIPASVRPKASPPGPSPRRKAAVSSGLAVEKNRAPQPACRSGSTPRCSDWRSRPWLSPMRTADKAGLPGHQHLGRLGPVAKAPVRHLQQTDMGQRIEQPR